MFTFTRTRPLSPPLRETNNFKRPGLLIHQSYVFISFRLFSFILFDICILHDDLHSRSFVQYINTGQQIRPAYISALSLCRTTARKFPFYDLALFWISASRESLLYLYIFFGMMRYLINMLWPVDTHTRAFLLLITFRTYIRTSTTHTRAAPPPTHTKSNKHKYTHTQTKHKHRHTRTLIFTYTRTQHHISKKTS